MLSRVTAISLATSINLPRRETCGVKTRTRNISEKPPEATNMSGENKTWKHQ